MRKETAGQTPNLSHGLDSINVGDVFSRIFHLQSKVGEESISTKWRERAPTV